MNPEITIRTTKRAYQRMVAEHADYSVEQELVQFGEGSLTFLEPPFLANFQVA